MAGAGGGAVTGFDMSAVLAMAGAAGFDAAAAVHLLPAIEAAMVREINKQSG